MIRRSALLLLFLPAAAAAQPSAIDLYRQLGSVGLDARRTYQVRGMDLDFEDIHLSLEDGVLSFVEPVEGHTTGAFFVGQGEVLIIPPDQAERASLGLFTGAGVLEEKFSSAYLRFDDQVASTLAANVRSMNPDAAGEFAARWNPLAKSLASGDALRLLLLLINSPPPGGTHLLHARLTGEKLGGFDVVLDSSLPEQISVAQTSAARTGALYYDVWMSFVMRSAREHHETASQEPVRLPDYKLSVHILPSHELEAEADVTVESRRNGLRAIIFELSRYLKIKSVTLNGSPVEFLQNEAIPGSQLARRGNDVMAVVLPHPLAADQRVQLHFSYAGSVISDLGAGLMFVGARGSWYPNRGAALANFDMQFRYPDMWSLIATGKQISAVAENGEAVAHWNSEKPIPLAGFNLGRYQAAKVTLAGNVQVTSYSVELPTLATGAGALSAAVPPPGAFSRHRWPPPMTPPPMPALGEQMEAPLVQRAASDIKFLTPLWGPYPYASLSLTPLPGPNSQGWPALIYLSEECFLPDASRPPVSPANAAYQRLLYDELMPAHEIAHQWWGDNVLWASYHDQWLMESLANYSALLEIAEKQPQSFHETMQRYRDDLVRPEAEHGRAYTGAGPVTLGLRLSSSRFPEGYERVLYERGAWLMHMLREVMEPPAVDKTEALADSPFISILRQIQQQFAGHTLSTHDLQHALEAQLPADARYDGKKSLDWFFQGWVNGDSVPKLELRDVHVDSRRGVAAGTILQREADKDLITLVPLYAARGDGAPVLVARIFADGEETTFKLKLPAGANRLLLDPYNTILRR